MRPSVDKESIRTLAGALAAITNEPLTLYLTGGATAVIEGWRASTVDLDIRVEPDRDEVFRVLPRLKDSLDINIELVSPPDFVPELPGWRDRSPIVLTERPVTVRHFDLYSQALSKIERGFAHDLRDLERMIESGMVEPGRLRALYAAVEGNLYRYPAIDPSAFRSKLERALSST